MPCARSGFSTSRPARRRVIAPWWSRATGSPTSSAVTTCPPMFRCSTCGATRCCRDWSTATPTWSASPTAATATPSCSPGRRPQEAFSGVRNARDTVLAGFTTVRDVGTFRAFVDVALRDAIDDGWVIGPRMQVAGAYVTCSGGGGDITGLAPDVDAGRAARSACRRGRLGRRRTPGGAAGAARRRRPDQADRDRLGDVDRGSAGRPRAHRGQIRAAVEEAALYGANVAAHAHGAEGIKRAVRGGVPRSSTDR